MLWPRYDAILGMNGSCSHVPPLAAGCFKHSRVENRVCIGEYTAIVPEPITPLERSSSEESSVPCYPDEAPLSLPVLSEMRRELRYLSPSH